MSAPFLSTYEDVLIGLEDYVRGRSGAGVSQRMFRACVETSLRTIAHAHDWAAFKRSWQVVLDGAKTTGTVVYQASGDVYDYEVTLTGSTWPTWAAQGEILIAGVVCDVDERKSTTVLTLKYPRVPVSDQSGVAYTLGRSRYPLPAEYMASWTPVEKSNRFLGRQTTMDEIHTLMRLRSLASGSSKAWSIGTAEDYYGSMALHVYPWPSSDTAFGMLLKFRPRTLVVTGKDTWNSAGTVSVTAAGTTVTGSSTAFSSVAEGSIIRFSASSSKPTDQGGSNPYVFQQSISSVTDATTLVIGSAAPSTLSAVGYVISDPVDVPAHMFDAFMACCEAEAAYKTGMDYPQNARRHYEAKLKEAKRADNQFRQPAVAGARNSFRSRMTDVTYRPEVGGT